MTVSTTTSKVSYSGNGSTVAFAVNFYFLANADLKVTLRSSTGVETVKTLGTDYSVTGAGVDAGGTVTMIVAPASGEKLVISRNAPLTQLVDYQPNDPFPATTHEQALDKLTMITQQQQEQLDRAVKTSISDTITPDQLLSSITTSAANAASSATAAAASATSAAASYDSFDDRYLGPKSSDPTLDNDGNALIAGAMYFSTTGNAMRVYNGSAWQDVALGTSFPYQTFSGNASTTAFTLSSTPGSLGSIEVFISGVRQYAGTDYTWSSGTTLTFTSAPPTGTNNIFVRWVTTQAINVPADGSVTTAKIVDAAVTTAKVADGAMTTAKHADNSITYAKLSADVQSALYGFKNRIINGAMMIDQRNAGASFTPASGASYGLDRYRYYLTQASKLTSQQSTTAPTGFINSLLVTSSSAYTVLSTDIFQVSQPIEGLNMADLAWGTASAATVTLSFWVRSSLTGTFGGSIGNSSGGRSYVFSYTVSSANTWEQKTITITGDQSGTWLTTNGVGAYINFGLGVGSNSSNTAGSWYGASYNSATGATSVVGTSGATFYITGVQLEKGSTATSFDYRPYGTELALCQRYYFRDAWTVTGSTNRIFMNGYMYSSTQMEGMYFFPVEMRTGPTLGMSAMSTWTTRAGSATISSIASYVPNTRSMMIYTTNSALTINTPNELSTVTTNGTYAYLEFSAEL